MHLQLQIVKGQDSSGKYFWYIDQPLEALSTLHLLKSWQCHYSSEGNCCTPQYSDIAKMIFCTDVVDNRAEIFDDAFEDLTKQGNWPATAASDVRKLLSDYFNSDHGSGEWQNDCA